MAGNVLFQKRKILMIEKGNIKMLFDNGIPNDWELKHFEDVADIDKDSLSGMRPLRITSLITFLYLTLIVMILKSKLRNKFLQLHLPEQGGL